MALAGRWMPRPSSFRGPVASQPRCWTSARMLEGWVRRMAWTTPRYTNSQVDAAGQVLVQGGSDQAKLDEAFEILNNWRAAHSFALNTFQMRLRDRAGEVYASALVAQRLKRVSSIIFKLQR